MIDMEYSEFLNKNFTYAIVGASNNTEKYGHRVLKDLKLTGYKVIPFNLHEKEILGLKVYKTLSESPKKIDVVNFVVPPQITLEILKEVKELGIKKVWMQPGSENEEAIKYCEDNEMQVIANQCIMIQRERISDK